MCFLQKLSQTLRYYAILINSIFTIIKIINNKILKKLSFILSIYFYGTFKFYKSINIYINLNGRSTIHSDDFYYLRTKHLDKLFELYFGNRLVINGKRLHSTTHTKKYM